MTPDSACPSVEVLRRSLDLDDPMPTTERQRIEAHVDHCAKGCKQVIDVLLRDHTLTQTADGTRPSTVAGTSSSAGNDERVAAVPGYEILGELGRGGMGVVYRARQQALGRVVALKMLLRPVTGAEAEEHARFTREALAIASLNHGSIVQIYELGRYGDQPFIATELVEGGSLAERLAGVPQPPQQAAALVARLAEAVQAAHQQQIIHRDLKPANILVAADGTPKITDFGLAKRLDTEGNTNSGVIQGTPSYMAPEQARGRTREIGPAADVYGLGAILYEMLTGRPPFRAATTWETLQQVVGSEPVPPSRLAVVPRDLETICLKCLDKEPAKRYATADALAEDLRRYRTGEPIAARPAARLERAVKWAKRRPALAALLGVTVLALVALSVLSGYLVKLVRAAENERMEAVKQSGIAQGKEREALKEAEKARKARDFLVSIFKISETDIQGGNNTAREILKDAEQRIPREFADQPELKADLLAAIGEINHSIALTVPRAMILEVSGAVQLQSARGIPKSALPQTFLYLEDRLTLSDDANIQIVVLADFHKEWLRPARKATVGVKGCEPADAVSERVDDLMMTFVRLRKGMFFMGWDGPDKPGKKTEIKEDFEIAVHTVTQGQWQAIMGNNPSDFSRQGNGRNIVRDISDEELSLFPVENVSWDDAQVFLKKLNEKERARGFLYRLPTSAEWEYACRGGATSEEECSYHFYFARPTNDLSSEQANFNGKFPFGKAPVGKDLERPTRVGAYPPNKLGLCDMHGNVWQWCSESEATGRVYRGGCWYNTGRGCRTAHRSAYEPSDRPNTLGLRLVRVPVR